MSQTGGVGTSRALETVVNLPSVVEVDQRLNCDVGSGLVSSGDDGEGGAQLSFNQERSLVDQANISCIGGIDEGIASNGPGDDEVEVIKIQVDAVECQMISSEVDSNDFLQ